MRARRHDVSRLTSSYRACSRRTGTGTSRTASGTACTAIRDSAPVVSGHVSSRSCSCSPAASYTRSLDGTAIAKKSTLASNGVAAELRPLDVAGGEHAGEQDRQLRVGAAELEVQVVDAEDRQRKRVRRIERHAHRHRAWRSRVDAIADDAVVAVLDVVAQPAIGLAVHDAIAAPRLVARPLEALRR